MPTMIKKKHALALCAVLATTQTWAGITLYEHDDFQGQGVTLQDTASNFREFGFNDRVSSVVVTGESWELCKDTAFRSHCLVLRPGRYPSMNALRINDRLSSARPVRGQHDAPRPDVAAAGGQIVFYQHPGFQGQGFGVSGDLDNFKRYGVNDQASSVIVFEGLWEACEDVNYEGRCMVLRPGRYPDLSSMGLNNRLSSVRAMRAGWQGHDDRYAPPPAPVYDWRRRRDERLYQVPVESVHAVYPARQAQRCWIEDKPSGRPRGDANVAGAIIGGVVGGIIGHQVGDGNTRDIATVGGAVVGAAVGAQVGRGGSGRQDLRRCDAPPAQQQPDYWDVTYRFRGQPHHVQMTSPPGPSLTVNRQGEPRY